MKLLSFDVGIKNLAYCLFEIDTNNKFKIIDWNIISLLNENIKPDKCSFIGKTPKKMNKKCEKKASYKYNNNCYCKTHVPKNLLLPIKNINKYKKEELQNVINYYEDISRIDLIKRIQTLMLIPIKNKNIQINCNDMCLIDIGKKITITLGELFNDYQIDHIIIENQISPLATRMKCIQCMISQFFIIKHPYSHIEFISSINKLKIEETIINDCFHSEKPIIEKTNILQKKNTFDSFNSIQSLTNIITDTTTDSLKYKKHKFDSIKYCKEYLMYDDPESNKPLTIMFNNSKKKDDLSDSFLQGIWYIKNKLFPVTKRNVNFETYCT
jgi:hypothetical protein